jgi:hypothetical protein
VAELVREVEFGFEVAVNVDLEVFDWVRLRVVGTVRIHGFA